MLERFPVTLTGALGVGLALLSGCSASTSLRCEDKQRASHRRGVTDPTASFAIVMTGPTTYEVPHALVDMVLANPIAAVAGAHIVPAIRNGQPHGYRLLSVRPSSMLAAVGLRNDDVITSINDISLVVPNLTFESLRTASVFRVAIERRGTALGLIWHVKCVKCIFSAPPKGDPQFNHLVRKVTPASDVTIVNWVGTPTMRGTVRVFPEQVISRWIGQETSISPSCYFFDGVMTGSLA